jgi:transcriptional regulator with XRE-family HTH domain
MNHGQLIRQAREREGLTQAALARRLATSQSTVARLEAGRGNPTIGTIDKALRACGHVFDLRSRQLKDEVDETLIAAQLRMTPAQRLATFESDYRQFRKLAKDAARSRQPAA